MTAADEAQQSPAPPSADELARLARWVGIFHARNGAAEADYKDVKTAVQPMFAAVRGTGDPSQEILLPDGSKAGLISVETGAEVVKVDEDLLTAIIAINDGISGDNSFEDYVHDRALRDPRVVALLAERYPELVGCRVAPEIRDRYQAEILERRGDVKNLATGERETVATITKLDATGKYSVRWSGKGALLLRDAVDSGLIRLDGTLAEPPAGDAPADPAGTAETADDDETCQPLPPDPDRLRGRGTGTSQHPPTKEQGAIIAAGKTGDNVVVEAGAGSGKTSTLKMSAAEMPGRGLYVSFNKAIASDARRDFPPHVECATAHSFAMAAVGRPYAPRLGGPRVPAKETARILGINGPTRVDADHVLAPNQIARLTMETVARFCHSADATVTSNHVPRQAGLDSVDAMAALRQALPPLARKAWQDICNPAGKLRFEHDHYLKMWQLTHPQLSADFIFYDEAQDGDPVILDVLTGQRNAQLIAVGDRAQQIYEWRGAVDALDKIGAKHHLRLTQSFRFGEAIAEQANRWLAVLGTDMRLRGFDQIQSKITTLDQPQAVLCRTNGGALQQAMREIDAGRKTALVGGGRQLRSFAEAAEALKDGRSTAHPELWAFATWAQVQDYVENDPAGGDLKVIVNLIDEHGPEVIQQVTDQLADEKAADVTISTVHKAKGREWESVRIAGDFREPRGDQELPPAEARLAYVAVTRARRLLDPVGLSWLDNYLRERLTWVDRALAGDAR